MLYAFDLLEFNGKDLRPLPLGERKAKLAKLLVRNRLQ
jgi:ATP-dependent DNA ligase